MNDEIMLRKQAVELHLKGFNKTEIAEKLGKSRQWVHKWIGRYLQIGGDSWYKSFSTAPGKITNKTKGEIEDLVVSIRTALDGQKYSQKGALSIMYEFKRIGITPPSITTINRILKRHHLVGESMNKMVKKKIIQIIILSFSRWIWLAQNTLLEASVFTFWILLIRKIIMQAFIL